MITKSKNDKIIAGVCGGFSKYFKIDPTVVRLIWVAITLLYGSGLLAYIIATIVMPEEKELRSQYTTQQDKSETSGFDELSYTRPHHVRNLIGGILVLIGATYLLKLFFHWISFGIVMAVSLVAIGLYIIFQSPRK